MHGLMTGQESRPQLYTMLTRGRHANHLYLQIVGDGDPHSVIRSDTIAPRTPTEPAHAEKAADAAEEQSPWRAANRAREVEPKAQECAKDHRRYEKVVSRSAAEKRSRQVKWGRV